VVDQKEFLWRQFEPAPRAVADSQLEVSGAVCAQQGWLPLGRECCMARTQHHAATARLLGIVAGSLILVESVLAQIPIIDPQQVIEASASDESTSQFGLAVAVDGDTALVGMAGQVGVYTRDPAGVWQRTDTLTRPVPIEQFDRFGLAVGLDGDLAVISSEANSINFRAHIFRRSNGIWRQTQILDAGDGICFQPVFVIENGVIAITTLSPEGVQQIFVLREDANGEFQTSATINLAARTLALNDTAEWLLAGHTDSIDHRGAVDVYRAVDSSWIRHQTLIAMDGAPTDGFGTALAIDDRAIVVGAQFANVGDGSGSGRAYEFLRAGDLWHESRQFQPVFDPEVTRRGIFGASVALNARFVMVSMPVGGSGDGMVFLYDRGSSVDTPDFTFVSRPNDMRFGRPIAVSGPTVFVSAPTAAGGEHGSVHVYSTDSVMAVLTPSGEARVTGSGGGGHGAGSRGGGGASDLLSILLLATLAAAIRAKSHPEPGR
jgi:hypothetical protein